MVEFSCVNTDGGISRYELTESDKRLATVSAKGNTVLGIEYADEATDKRYGSFTLRSIAFILRNNFSEVRFKFTDERLTALGFTKDGEGMFAPSYRIVFDNCCCI